MSIGDLQETVREWKVLYSVYWPYWNNSCRVLPTCCETPTWELCTHKPLEMIVMFLSLSFIFGLHALPLASTSRPSAIVAFTVVCFNFGWIIWLAFLPHATWEWSSAKEDVVTVGVAIQTPFFVSSPLIETKWKGKKKEKEWRREEEGKCQLTCSDV